MGVTVQVETKRLDELTEALGPRGIDRLLMRAGFEAQGIAQSVHKYQNRTGYLTSSARTEQSAPGEVSVGYTALYAPYVEAWDAFLEPALQKAGDKLKLTIEAIMRKAAG